MGYSGNAYAIPYDRTGINDNPNIDLIPPSSIIHPSRNINIHENGVGKRGGTAKVNGTVISGTPRIMGIKNFRLRSGTSFVMFAGDDGSVYKNTTTTIKTGLSTSNKFSFIVFDNQLYFADGANVPQSWDGSAGSSSDLTTVPASWTGSNYPGQLIVHQKKLSTRVVALNFPTDRDDFYLSANDNPNDFSTPYLYFPIRTGSGYGITGGQTFGDRLILFSKEQAYLFDDDSLIEADWGIVRAQWAGGVSHWRLIVKTFNDLINMTDDGVIYSVRTAQEFGDYRKADLTKPSNLDRWIRNNIDLSAINDFHGVFDPVRRIVRFFVKRIGQSQIDTSLNYHIDRPPEIAWTIHDNQDFTSGYNASASGLIEVSTGDFQIYTGNYAGFLWKLEQSNKNDDSNGYWSGARTPNLDFQNPRSRKHYKRGKAVMEPKGNYSLNIRTWIDGNEIAEQTLSLAGIGSLYGTGVYGTATYGGDEVIAPVFDIGSFGVRIQHEYYNNTADEDFFISQALIDHRVLGARANENK